MSPAIRSVLALLLFFAVTFLAAGSGARYMPGEWYAQLSKPTWNPPSWIFAPVWTLLYICMAVAAWLVWRRNGLLAAATPLAVFLVQLSLNSLWTWFFFGLQRPGLAFADIVALWMAIVTTLVLFWRVSTAAGALFLPYLAWVSFAAVLNFTLWRMNAS
jgi:translocator protein